MTELLSRLFVKDHRNVSDPAVRRRYGTMVSVIGILVNVLLAAGKTLIGVLSASVSILADAVNNLSDAGSSVISLISFRISAKPADRDHPYGHARIEYVASMIVAFLILLIGFEFLKESVTGIFCPTAQTFDVVTLIVLAVSIAGKLWLMLLNRKIGKKVNSGVMRAAAADSLSDVLSTSCVLLSVVASFVAKTAFGTELPFPLDAWVGIAVACFILYSGARILNETKNSILGEAPDPVLVGKIRELVFSYPETKGIHDMMVHSYGSGHMIASLHVEVDGNADIFASHEVIDAMETRLQKELGVLATIHLDPIVIGDPIVDEMHEMVRSLVAELYPGAGIHDFRMVKGEKRCNLIFDLELPFEVKEPSGDVIARVQSVIHTCRPECYAVIHVDRV